MIRKGSISLVGILVCLFILSSHIAINRAYETCVGAPPTRLQKGITAIVTVSKPGGVRETLRVRTEPGGEIITSLSEGTAVRIIDDPVCLNGVLWWKIATQDMWGWSAEALVAGDYFLTPLKYVPQEDIVISFPDTPPDSGTVRLNLGSAKQIIWRSDGKAVAVAGNLGIWVYTDTFELIIHLYNPNYQEIIHNLAWSPDGRFIATVATAAIDAYESDYGETVRLWDVVTGVEAKTLIGNGEFAASPRVFTYNLQFLSNETLVDDDESPRGWSIVNSPDGVTSRELTANEVFRLTNRVKPTLLPDALFTHSEATLIDSALSPDGTRAATINPDGTLSIWSADGETQFAYKQGHVGGDYSHWTDLAYSPDGTKIASATVSRSYYPDWGANIIQIWDAVTHETLVTFTVKGLYYVQWSPDGKRLLLTGSDTRIQVWDVDKHQQLYEDAPLEEQTDTAQWIRSREAIVTYPDRSDPQVGFGILEADGRFQQYSFTDPEVKQTVLTSDGRWLATLNNAGVVSAYDLLSDSPVAQKVAEVDWVEQGVWLGDISDNGQYLAVMRDDRISIMELATGNEVCRYDQADVPLWRVEFSPDNTELFLIDDYMQSYSDAQIQILNIEQCKVMDILENPWWVVDMVWSPDHQQLATRGGWGDTGIKLWQRSGDTYEFLRTIYAHRGVGFEQAEIFNVVWSPDGQTLVSSGLDGAIYIHALK